MKDRKIKITSEAHGRAVQEALFKLGHRWSAGAVVSYRNATVISTYSADMYLSFGSKPESFNQSTFPAYELVDGEIVPEGTLPKPVVRDHNQVRADRRKELLDGVVAYHTAGKAVPDEWLSELSRGWMGM